MIKQNPNPSPIEKMWFGLSCFGGDKRDRTADLLNAIERLATFGGEKVREIANIKSFLKTIFNGQNIVFLLHSSQIYSREFWLIYKYIEAPEARRNPTGIIHQATIMGSTELNPMFSFKRSTDSVFEMLPALKLNSKKYI